jgi:6-phosphofructokinase 1
LQEVVEKSQAVRVEIENGNYSKALDLRGESFRNTLDLVKTLSRISPSQERSETGAIAILTGGADAPGMNAAVSVAARCLMNQGVRVFGSMEGYMGMVKGNLIELDWHELVGWVNRPSSEIGTARFDFVEEDYARIADTIRRFDIKGLIAIGGWGTYSKTAQLVERRKQFEAFKIPTILIPASIDNNLPSTEFSIGSDTALNNIIDAVDKIRHTAGATRRAFIVEVMGRQCGFLALMSALASGAEKAYLPEIGITLADLNKDVEDLKRSFASGKRMVIYMRSEQSSYHYTTDFIRRLLEEESKGQFEVRTAILGHVQRGGIPTAFDRIIASRLGATGAFTMLELLESKDDKVMTLGLLGRGMCIKPLSETIQEVDLRHGRPWNQWFMELVSVNDALAKHTPDYNLDDQPVKDQ